MASLRISALSSPLFRRYALKRITKEELYKALQAEQLEPETIEGVLDLIARDPNVSLQDAAGEDAGAKEIVETLLRSDRIPVGYRTRLVEMGLDRWEDQAIASEDLIEAVTSKPVLALKLADSRTPERFSALLPALEQLEVSGEEGRNVMGGLAAKILQRAHEERREEAQLGPNDQPVRDARHLVRQTTNLMLLEKLNALAEFERTNTLDISLAENETFASYQSLCRSLLQRAYQPEAVDALVQNRVEVERKERARYSEIDAIDVEDISNKDLLIDIIRASRRIERNLREEERKQALSSRDRIRIYVGEGETLSDKAQRQRDRIRHIAERFNFQEDHSGKVFEELLNSAKYSGIQDEEGEGVPDELTLRSLTRNPTLRDVQARQILETTRDGTPLPELTASRAGREDSHLEQWMTEVCIRFAQSSDKSIEHPRWRDHLPTRKADHGRKALFNLLTRPHFSPALRDQILNSQALPEHRAALALFLNRTYAEELRHQAAEKIFKSLEEGVSEDVLERQETAYQIAYAAFEGIERNEYLEQILDQHPQAITPHTLTAYRVRLQLLGGEKPRPSEVRYMKGEREVPASEEPDSLNAERVDQLEKAARWTVDVLRKNHPEWSYEHEESIAREMKEITRIRGRKASLAIPESLPLDEPKIGADELNERRTRKLG